MSAPSSQDLYRAAQELIRQEQPVFPCAAKGNRSKAPLTKNGLYDATTDRNQIKAWLRAKPDLALAIPTGIVWDVLDVDTKRGVDGRAHLPTLNRLGLLDGCKRVIRTPSGGWHLYFRTAPGLTNKARALLGLDVRTKGGYVLVPPSYIETEDYAGSYEVIGDTVGSTDAPLLWDLIVTTLAPVDEMTKKPIDLLPSERRASIAHLREWVSVRLPGERNNALHWAVCRCIESGLDPHELVDAALLSGLGEEETMKTIESALRRAGVSVTELDSEAEALFPDE